MTMFTAPTKEQYRSAYQLAKGQYAMQFADVKSLMDSELRSTIDKLMLNRDKDEMLRLQGRAQALKDFLSFFDEAPKHADRL